MLSSYHFEIKYLLLFMALFVVGCNPTQEQKQQADSFRETTLIYTKHAKCRMNCRHIDDSEVIEIIASGNVNYKKSDTHDKPCPTYAIEGITHDKQHVRIIVADCDGPNKIVTVIDLENDYKCDCK